MLQRTFATAFLLTLLVAQTLSGVCRLRCDHNSGALQTPSCHSMPMADDTPKAQASGPCATHPCPTSDAVIAATQTGQQNIASSTVDAPRNALPSAVHRMGRPLIAYSLAPPASPHPVPPASLLKTTLRL